jgi:hypothetical protein
VARFEPRDSAGTVRTVLTSIHATGTARSLTVEPQEARPKQPTINYARGDAIVVTMKADGSEEVNDVRIRGRVEGVQIEPGADAASPGRAGQQQPESPAGPEAPEAAPADPPPP